MEDLLTDPAGGGLGDWQEHRDGAQPTGELPGGAQGPRSSLGWSSLRNGSWD